MMRLFFRYVCIISLLFVNNAAALERLFTSQEQRYRLDHPVNKVQSPTESETIEASPVRMNGFVQNKQGRKTVWVNGDMQLKSVDGVKALGLSPGQSVIDKAGRRVKLKPGQLLDMKRHEIIEVFEYREPALNPDADQPENNADKSVEIKESVETVLKAHEGQAEQQ